MKLFVIALFYLSVNANDKHNSTLELVQIVCMLILYFNSITILTLISSFLDMVKDHHRGLTLMTHIKIINGKAVGIN